jgi:hypothetical protein
MSITYETYIIHLPKDQALAALKTAAEAQRLQIEEESEAGFFCLERRKRRHWIFSGPPSRLVVSVEPDQQQTIVTVVAWGAGIDGGFQGRLVWRLLAESGLASIATPAGFASPGPGGVYAWSPCRAPSWVARTRFGTNAPLILCVPMLIAAIWIGVSFGAWYGVGLLWFWLLLFVFGPPLVSDIVPRRVLGIRSRRGIVRNVSIAAASAAAYLAIIMLTQAIVRWLD